MTSDPKAPGAAAVYLNVEEVTNDPIHYQTFYARIKVLQEKGKQLATVEVPYMRGVRKVEAIKGRTIHPDGTIIPLAGKPEDLLIVKKGENQIDKKVFNLPGVEVGSIIEYTYQLSYDDNHFSSPLWEIQRPYFVHKAHYSFIPFKGFQKGPQSQTSEYLVDSKGGMAATLIWTAILPPGMSPQSDAMGHYSVDMTDILPAPQEEWMPPTQSFLYKVLFYYSSSPSAEKYWEEETRRWSKEVDRFAEVSKPIKQAVEGIVGPADTPLDKAKKLYIAVQALDNTDFSRAKSKTELKQLGLKQAKHAEDTWAQKSGSSQDITLLYLAMARAAGLEAYDLKVVDRDSNLFSPSYLDFGQLDDDLIILKIDGKEMILDHGEKMCPFQTFGWRHSATSGARQSKDGNTASTTPFLPYAANTTFRSGDVTLDAHGGITGSIKFVMAGQEALRWRQQALRNDLDEVKKSFDRWLGSMVPDGVEAHVESFEALDDPYQKLTADIKVQGTLGVATSKRFLLPGFFFETRGSHPFVDQEKRIESVDMHYGEIVTDQMIYHLPPGLSVEAAPHDSKISWENHAALLVKARNDPGQIAVARQFARGFTVVKAEEYQDLRGFYQKVAAADQQQLILTSTPVAQGN
jgi:hypothetical protein